MLKRRITFELDRNCPKCHGYLLVLNGIHRPVQEEDFPHIATLSAAMCPCVTMVKEETYEDPPKIVVTCGVGYCTGCNNIIGACTCPR